jgi:hypothetical protein
MSASPDEQAFGFTGEATRSRSEIKKNSDEIYKNSFGDLEDGTIYRDPLGAKTGGQPVELQKDRWDQLLETPVDAFAQPGTVGKSAPMSIIEKWNELQRKGYSLEDTFGAIQKSLDTGDWTLPLDIIPEVFAVNPERLPLANTIPRVTTQDDEVVATPIQDYPEFEFDLEGGAPTDGDGNRTYNYDQPTYGDLTFQIVGMGLATRLSDKLILASNNLRNAENTQEQAMMRGAMQTLERQLIRGTNFKSDGFDGLDDFISSGDGSIDVTLDDASANPEDYEDATRTLIDEAEFEGADSSNLAVICDYDWHRNVRDSVTDVVRYEPMADAFGVSSVFEYDDVPVMRSNAINRISETSTDTTETKAYTVNLDAHYLSVLQEVSMRPLARLGPQERISVDGYMALTAEDNGAHISAAEVTGA